MPADTRPVLYIVACGAPPASQLPAFVRDAQLQGWDVCVVATPDGIKFLDAGNLAGLTGHPVRFRYKRPDEPDVLPPPNALAVVPATFNTINKWAQGISDTLALGLLNEAVGLRLPIGRGPLAERGARRSPGVRAQRRRAPRMGRHGDPGRRPAAGAGRPGSRPFPWDELRAVLPGLRASGPNRRPASARGPRLPPGCARGSR